jgi:AcrR family transcriptional regulator
MRLRASTARKPAPSGRRGEYSKSQGTRERILAAALKVAATTGLHGASLAAIATKADVAIGNLHYHFGSREDLLTALMRQQVVELQAAVREAIDAHENFFAKDEAALRAYIRYIRTNPACVRLAEEVRVHRPKLYAETTELWLTMFRDAIRQGVRRGELRPLRENEVSVLAHLLLGARYFIDQMMADASGRPPSEDLMVATYVSLTRNGLESR